MIYIILLLKIEKKKIVDNQYENDFINFNDVITPNYYIGIKPRETILK